MLNSEKSTTRLMVSSRNPNHEANQAVLRKAILRNPTAVCRNFIDKINKDADVNKFNLNAKQLDKLNEQRAQLANSRKALSRSIGQKRKLGENIECYLSESKGLSARINVIDSEITSVVDELLAIHQRHIPSTCTGTQEEGTDTKIEVFGPRQFTPIPSGGTLPMEVTILETDNEMLWDEYVAAANNSTHYHQYKWRGIVERNFSIKCKYFAAINASKKIIGIVPSAQMDNRISGSYVLSMPFLIYGGPVSDSQAIDTVLANRLASLTNELGFTHTELRETHSRDGWYSNLDKVAMVLPLPASKEILNKEFGSKLLSQVRRASREKPVFEFGKAELIPEFYDVFSRKMRDHGTPVYAITFFQDIAATFPESTHVAVVRLKGKAVAAAFLIGYRDTLEIPWAASIRKFDQLGMNMFLYHSLLEEAVSQNFRFFDFGRSTKEGSTWKFKKQWGAKEQQLHWHFLADGKPYTPGAGKASTKFTLAVAIWKRLPLGVANRLGPIIAKYLPW